MKQVCLILTLILSLPHMAQGQNHGEAFEELINEYVVRCQNGPPTILPFANRKGYLVEISDSTWVDYPQGRTYKMSQEDLGAEQAYKFSQYYHISDTLYVVHDGAGVVYRHDGQTLQRVDESYYHHNQYGAASFAYNGHLYLFGGTGLFTRKDILTYYDPMAREWLLQETTGQRPDLTQSMAGIVIDDYFYLIGEPFIDARQYDLELSREIEKRFSVYRLNLNTWHWDLLGSLDPELSHDIYSIKYFVVDPEKELLYVNCPRGLFAIDFVRNTAERYDNPYPILGHGYFWAWTQGICSLFIVTVVNTSKPFVCLKPSRKREKPASNSCIRQTSMSITILCWRLLPYSFWFPWCLLSSMN